jgi:hypothetical protein
MRWQASKSTQKPWDKEQKRCSHTLVYSCTKYCKKIEECSISIKEQVLQDDPSKHSKYTWHTKKFHPWHLTYPEQHNGQKKSTKACLIIQNAAQKACGQERMHRKKTCRWTLVSNWLLSAYSLKTDAMEGTVTCHANATSNSLWSYNVHENSATSRSPIRTISTQKALSNTVMHPKDALWEVNKVRLSLCQIGCWSTKLHNNVPYPILMQISNRNRKHSVEA